MAKNRAKAEVSSGRGELELIRTSTDELSVNALGHLQIEGNDATELLARYGSPLFVMSESTLRANARRVMTAFERRWPGKVNVMFAIKANNTLAVRGIMSQVGLGGDCFSSGEIHGTIAGGTDPSKVALNGSNKSLAAIEEAISHGMVINLDALEELDLVLATARRLSTRARVAVRLRLSSTSYVRAMNDDPKLPDIVDFINTEQVGSSYVVAKSLLLRAIAEDDVEVVGYHFHLGRLSRDPSYHRWWSAELGKLIVKLMQETGFQPKILNTGGGYAREREPESGVDPLMNPHTIEDYAQQVTSQLLMALQREGMAIPELWIEPGRYLAGNAGVLLSTVGAVKNDVGMIWINVDASINDLPRVENARWDYAVLPASQMNEGYTQTVDVVGSLCVGRHLKTNTPLPRLERGAVLAFLDTGAYAETASNQYNAIPRPATVLVHGKDSWLVKRRETIDDLYGRHSIPSHVASKLVQPTTNGDRTDV